MMIFIKIFLLNKQIIDFHFANLIIESIIAQIEPVTARIIIA